MGILITVLSISNSYNGNVISIACELLPIVFSLLTFIFLIAYFKVEWMGLPIFLIIATVCLIFISYLISLGFAGILIKIVG